MQKYFTIDCDFEKIIKSKFKNVSHITQIKSGWTNFVFDVKSNNNSYIFRFPRNEFFSDALIKEIDFSNFIKDKISFKTNKLQLCESENRAYSLHKKINGRALSEVMNDMSANEIERFSKQICNFILQLQKIDVSTQNLGTCSSFLDNLSRVSESEYDLSKHDILRELESQKLVLNHGDLNPGNIIVDEDYNIVAILDYAFVSMSCEINDLIRLVGRLPKKFHNILISQFENMSKIKIDKSHEEKLTSMWNYVEEKYVEYIKKHHKDIILPEGL